jgi:poly(hydroxyalkanoate) granule-associated protein
MVKKIQKSADESSAAGRKSGAQLAGTVKDSAQQIWLAGLGAFAKAQEEGTKVFDALVKEGVTLQKKTQSAAEEKITEATSRMASMATDISSRASGQWNKMEGIFEERVSRAMGKLGVPSAKDVEAMMKRIDELERTVARLSKPGARAAAPAGGAAKTARKRVARKSL